MKDLKDRVAVVTGAGSGIGLALACRFAQAGMRLVQVLKLTRSLGRRVAEDPETYEWRDAGGDGVRVQLQRGRLDTWTLQRADAEVEAGGSAEATAGGS